MPSNRSDKPGKARAGQSKLTRWNISRPVYKIDPGEYGKPANRYTIRLYVAGSSINSLHAIASVQKLCVEYLQDKIDLEVVDLYQQPHLAKEDDVVAVPCLVKIRPKPRTMYVGRMDDCENLLIKLGIDPGKLKH
jgi:circadian clock protein KaiB